MEIRADVGKLTSKQGENRFRFSLVRVRTGPVVCTKFLDIGSEKFKSTEIRGVRMQD